MVIMGNDYFMYYSLLTTPLIRLKNQIFRILPSSLEKKAQLFLFKVSYFISPNYFHFYFSFRVGTLSLYFWWCNRVIGAFGDISLSMTLQIFTRLWIFSYSGNTHILEIDRNDLQQTLSPAKNKIQLKDKWKYQIQWRKNFLENCFLSENSELWNA